MTRACSHCGRQLWTFRDAFTACGVCDLMLGCPGEPWEIQAPYDWQADFGYPGASDAV